MALDSVPADDPRATARAAAQGVPTLYGQFLDSWNNRDAAAMARLFTTDGMLVGFDGSTMAGPEAVETTIGQIFADHETMPYVGKVRELRILAPGCALLRAVAGMPHRGQTTINPAANAIQSLVAVQRHGTWRIAHLQTTPAQFHGRPEVSQALTDELQELLTEVKYDGS